MAGILEYSSDRTSNTTINGIGITGSDTVKHGNDVIQQLMADAKSAVTKIVDKAAGSYTAVKADYNQLWRVTGTATINLTAAATLTAGWCLWVMADGATATIDPAGSEKINGGDTLALTDGNAALIFCTATDFRAIIFNAPFDTATLGDAAFLNVGTTAGTVAAGDDSRIVNAVPNSRAISAGTGLTGGGNLSADRAFAVDATVWRDANPPSSSQIISALGYTPAGFYTGSTTDNTNYPVGQVLACTISTETARNASVIPRLSGTSTGFTTASGTAVSGTWRAKGTTSTGIYLIQRVA